MDTKKKTHALETTDCPECLGGGLVPGARYTDTVQCPTCNGTGLPPAEPDDPDA